LTRSLEWFEANRDSHPSRKISTPNTKVPLKIWSFCFVSIFFSVPVLSAYAQDQPKKTEVAVRKAVTKLLDNDSLVITISDQTNAAQVAVVSILAKDKTNKEAILNLTMRVVLALLRCPDCRSIQAYKVQYDASEKDKAIAVIELQRSVAEKVEWQNMNAERFESLLVKHGRIQLAKRAAKTAMELRKEKIERQFSPWDGSHFGLARLIQKTMNDPSSYEHVKTVYADKGDYLIVITTFRGKNRFGGLVLNSVTAKVDLDGNVIEILTEDP
jgi:hypothetical protein